MKLVDFNWFLFLFDALVLPTLRRRKTTRMKYDPPYTKKPSKAYTGGAASNANHHSVEEVSLDGSNKLITYGNTFR